VRGEKAMSNDGPQEALKTYIEQTKLVVTLASGFLIAPAALIPLYRSKEFGSPPAFPSLTFVLSEMALIFSIFFGYLVMGSIAGSQHANDFNVYRKATRIFSILQLTSYVIGLIFFVWLFLGGWPK
jgi:hypothetical protein